MLISEVKKLSPIDRLAYWIVERESVRLKKASGKPKPWTDDSILQSYRFCNAKRMDDKVSKWLLQEWYEPFFNHKNMLVAACIARFFNKPESLEMVTEYIFKDTTWPKIKDAVSTVMRTAKEEGMTIYNGAYMVRGNDGCDKVSSVMDHYVQSVVDKKIRPDTSSMENTWADLKECYGWGSFMAGQVVADLRWAMEGTWADKLTWAPIGPGSARGMNRIHGRDLKAPLPQEQFQSELTTLMSTLKTKLPLSIFSRLEAHDFQNTLCETDKYNRVVNDEGKRPKQKYPGV